MAAAVAPATSGREAALPAWRPDGSGPDAPSGPSRPGSPLFFDLEGPEEGDGRLTPLPTEIETRLRQQAQAMSAPSTRGELQLLEDVRFVKVHTVRELGRCDTRSIARKLARAGYRVTLRTALGGGHGQHCFEHLYNEFLVVSAPTGGPASIVDPAFRSNFELSDCHTTPAYAAALPPAEEFVGSEARVAALVRFLCGEMATAFRAMGRTVPPWRCEGAMLSKWLPSRARDELLGRDGSRAQASSNGRSGDGSRSSGKALEGGSGTSSSPGSSGSPMSPLQLHGSSSGREQLPAAAANSAHRPLAVQTGFSVAPGASLLSLELCSQQAAASPKPMPRPTRVRFAGVDGTPPASGPFDMWPSAGGGTSRSGGGSGGAISGDTPLHAGMPAIRTVKMTGRCR